MVLAILGEVTQMYQMLNPLLANLNRGNPRGSNLDGM